ncbi:MAG: 4Fe-4S dicluster domain-containing protein [Planctomycetes bacterium]|nr:4Fe-4S dicluster domain-containing protein [Planctomycetota bacterium]
MSIAVDPTFLPELRRFGAFDVNACFNCGNCTAVCPLSTGNDSFPRKMIRYAQIGERDHLLAHKELWLCYYCGECSDTCPRQAEPGEFMAAARRYAIASYEPTGISYMLYTSKLFTTLFMVVLSTFFAVLLLMGHGPLLEGAPHLFAMDETKGFLSFELIHDTGLILFVVAGLAALGGIVRMTLRLTSAVTRTKPAEREEGARTVGFFARIFFAVRNVIAELAAQKRYRDCEEEPKLPWYRGRWFVHMSIMWGFIGLGVATGLDYLLMLVADKVPGQPDPLWWPTRLLGTVAGLLMMYGVSLALVQRYRKPNKYASHSLLSDWLFLWLLWIAGLTGFVLEVALYLPTMSAWGYVVFLVHVVVAMEVIVLLPFTKFAHSIYRPLALLVHEFCRAAAD